MLNDSYQGRRVINEGQLEESLYFSQMSGSIAHHNKQYAFTQS